MGVSMHTERGEIAECHATTFAIDLASCGIFAHDLGHFEVKHVRRVQ